MPSQQRALVQKNFSRLISVLTDITSQVDLYPQLVELSSKCHSCFVLPSLDPSTIFAAPTFYPTPTSTLTPLATLLEPLQSFVVPQAFILALLYIDRLSKSTPTLLLNSTNVLRISITCIIIAQKFMEPEHEHSTQAHQQNQCLPIMELLQLKSLKEYAKIEFEILKMMQFQVFVSRQEYDQY